MRFAHSSVMLHRLVNYGLNNIKCFTLNQKAHKKAFGISQSYTTLSSIIMGKTLINNYEF